MDEREAAMRARPSWASTIAMTVGARLYRRIAQAREAGALTGAAHARTMRAWGRMGGLLLALLLMVVGLMVFKPGVG